MQELTNGRHTTFDRISLFNDPESGDVYREVRAEALTGGNAGQPVSCEIYLPGADRVVLHGKTLMGVTLSR